MMMNTEEFVAMFDESGKIWSLFESMIIPPPIVRWGVSSSVLPLTSLEQEVSGHFGRQQFKCQCGELHQIQTAHMVAVYDGKLWSADSVCKTIPVELGRRNQRQDLE